MVRYQPDHKPSSRKKLVEASAALFRRHGYAGVGINDLCAAAGLTRGAFYGHFSSKAGLLTAVLEGGHDFVRRLRARDGQSGERLRAQGVQVAGDYLDPKHRHAVISGCSIASLAMEVTRGEPEAQAAYAAAVKDVVAEFRRGGNGKRLDADAARAALALCVGGLLIDNACGSDPEGPRMARAARREVQRLLNGR